MAETYLEKQRRLAREAAARKKKLDEETQAQINKKNALRISQLSDSKKRELARSKETYEVASAYGGGSAAKREYEARNAEITSRFSKSGPPKPKSKPEPKAEVKPKPKSKPAPGEVKPTKPPINASEQKTTTTRPPAQPARTESKPQAKQSSNMDDNYAAWVKANRKLAEKVKPGQAGYDSIQKALGKSSGSNDSMKIDKPAPKSGSSTNASSNTRFTAEEEKRGSAAFNQDSVKKLGTKETAEQRRKRLERERNRNIA